MYHHERYDAMTSNRVYRKKLDMSVSVGLGITFLIMSVIFRYGASLTDKGEAVQSSVQIDL